MPEQLIGEPVAQQLAAWAAALRLEDVPVPVVHAAKRVLLDTVGVMLAGASEPELRAMAGQLAGQSASAEATLVGHPERADLMTAALVNGTAGVWHDYDPGNRWLGGHPAAHAVPAALAVAEPQRSPGAELLEAVVAGYEVAALVGGAATLRPGMHPHGTWATTGAAAAAARLMRHDPDLVRESIAIAAALPLATSWRAALEGASIRNVYAGVGAANGVLAAELAGAGMTGQADGIEDVYGDVAGTGFDAARARPGGGWAILRGYHKLHACARYLHPALDALRQITATGPVGPDEVERIEVATFSFAAGMDDAEPATALAACFSLPHALAATLVRRDTGIDAFGPSATTDPQIRSLAARVAVTADPAMDTDLPDQRPATVAVVLRDGRRLEGSVRQARGEPDGEAVDDAELGSKFVDLAARTLGAARAGELLAALWEVESMPDTRTLLALARPA